MFERVISVLLANMQFAKLTDDELWRGIAQNTEAMSALARRQLKLNAANACAIHPGVRADLIHLANRIDRRYREYAAELRRRYSLG
jgi:hypothetical protein